MKRYISILIALVISLPLFSQIGGSSGIGGNTARLNEQWIPVCYSDGVDTLTGYLLKSEKGDKIFDIEDNEVVGAFEVDGKYCKEYCELQTFYRVVGDIGSVEQKWTASSPVISGAGGTSYLQAFTATDADGYPSIAVAPDVITSNTVSATINDASTAQDAAQSDFWIYLSEENQLREFAGTAEAVGIWISESCGSERMIEVLDATYTNTQPNPLGTFKKGFYKVRLYHSDVSSNGTATLQASTDGTTWATLPAYTNKPKVEEIKGWVCDDGLFYNQDKSLVLDPTEWLCNNPDCTECCDGGTNTTQRVHENFVVTGTTPLVIPAGAISISVTKTNNTGIVNISGDNGTSFPLTFNRENFGDAVNEGYSTLSAYTITGTNTNTNYKVHIIR